MAIAALPESVLTGGKAGDAHIFHSSSYANRETGSVGSKRSAVLLVVSL